MSKVVARGQSWLGNRTWTVVASESGVEWRVVQSFPGNPAGLPNSATGDLARSMLFVIALDALLWLFGRLPYRTVSLYRDLGKDANIDRGWGKLYARRKRVALTSVADVMKEYVALVDTPAFLQVKGPRTWTWPQVRKTAWVCLPACVASFAVAFPVRRDAPTLVQILSICATAILICFVDASRRGDRHYLSNRTSMSLMLTFTPLAMLAAVLAYVLPG